MKLLAITFKVWLAVALLAAVIIGLWIVNQGGVNIFFDDEPISGSRAVLLATGLTLAAIVATSFALAVLGAIIPIVLVVILLALLVGFGITGLALAAVFVTLALPVLIPLGVCVLLMRHWNRPKVTPT